jgi:hypothetical protein
VGPCLGHNLAATLRRMVLVIRRELDLNNIHFRSYANKASVVAES